MGNLPLGPMIADEAKICLRSERARARGRARARPLSDKQTEQCANQSRF